MSTHPRVPFIGCPSCKHMIPFASGIGRHGDKADQCPECGTSFLPTAHHSAEREASDLPDDPNKGDAADGDGHR